MILGVSLRRLAQLEPLGRTVWLLAVEDDDGIAALVVTGLPFVHGLLLLVSPCRRYRES